MQHVQENHEDQDFLIYPIVFLYRHHIELQLKETITMGEKILASGLKPPTTHRLDLLWSSCREIINKILEVQPTSDLMIVDRAIQRLIEYDADATAFRYFRTKEGTISLPKTENISIRHYAAIIDSAATVLDGTIEAISSLSD